MKLTAIEIIADKGKYVARKGTDNYFTRGTLLKGETLEDFVEVDTLPSAKLGEAKSKKKAEITAYDTSSEVNSFSLQGQEMWLPNNGWYLGGSCVDWLFTRRL